MADIYEEFTEQETTSAVLDDNRLVNFAYDDKAFRENDTEGRETYNYNANNNIPLSTGLSTETQTLGFGGKSGVFKRSFWNHTAGRISYNLNKTIQALRTLLGSFREDYSENISEYSTTVKYRTGDVCFRLSGNTITFYRCISPTSGGDFDGRFWTKPEEELSHDRPAVGVPVPWFEKVPEDWAIRFDDGASYTWEQCPALNFTDFRALVTLTEYGFTVPDFRGRVPMFTGGANEVLDGYDGEEFDACLQPHSHAAPALTFTLPSTSISHTHDSTTSGGSGNHQHEILERCDADDYNNRSRIPVYATDEYRTDTATNSVPNHGHTGTTTGSGVTDHVHQVTVTGQTGAVKGSEAGDNPDSFQHCWIVRYR